MSEQPKKTDERVRIRAYHLWERDGRPHGRNEEYWARALAEIQGEESGKTVPNGSDPARTRPPPP